MDLKELRKYANWLSHTPADVIKSVKNVGGWTVVFPNSLPLWAHRVRNYFNEEPISLTRLDAVSTRKHLAGIEAGLDTLDDHKYRKWLKEHPMFGQLPDVKKLPDPPPHTPEGGILDNIAEDNALSGEVYSDHVSKIWYQMAAGGTIYHWGSDPVWSGFEAVRQNVRGQAITPIFKLVSPDGTGGSHETIIENLRTETIRVLGKTFKIGRISIGAVNKSHPVSNLVNTNVWHQGSYNYSETTVVGLLNHERRDVDTHKKHASISNVYVNPPNRFLTLAQRAFPEKAPGEQVPLADQI
jgi:hypothetical protein